MLKRNLPPIVNRALPMWSAQHSIAAMTMGDVALTDRAQDKNRQRATPIVTETARFRERRDVIVDAAADIINHKSVKGMTFAAVAQRVGLKPANVTYYFRRKEELVGAAFDRTLDYLNDLLREAVDASDIPAVRIRHFMARHFERLAAMRTGDAPALAVLSDVRASDEPERSRLLARWREVFRNGRALWGEPTDRFKRDLFGARAHVLLENAFWLTVWIEHYDLDEWPRVEARLLDVMIGGIAVPGTPWAPMPIDLSGPAEPSARPAFLDVATRLINEFGYRGASVQRIVSDLNVTKGSFYHHLDAKHDLIMDCYERSFDVVAAVQRDADRLGGSAWDRLCSVVAVLVDAQLGSGGTPILRTTAMRGLPLQNQMRMLEQSERMARRFADRISDGIAERSCRPVDALIAAHALMALQNAAFDMRSWASSMPRSLAVERYASTLLFGLGPPD